MAAERARPGVSAVDCTVARGGRTRKCVGALRLDVGEQPWPVGSAAAVVSLNMIHIAPWDSGRALIRGAAAILEPGAVRFLYGPFRRGAMHTSPSNEAFDRQLRAQNPAWGVRDLEDVARYAAAHGFGPPETHDMPAHNLSVVLRKRAPQALTD